MDINSLPDPILCHVLSFLPIKYSVATSVLARRWRFLWTYIRNLHFGYDEYYYSTPKNRMGFSDMVYRVLLLHNGPIDKLSICSDDDTRISPCQVDVWISTAIVRNVQVLYLSVTSDVRLPQCCFRCKTLVELTIEYFTISAKSGAVCLPRLKKLHLDGNFYEDDESLPNLISGCSAIENLVIERDMDGCDGMTCCYVGSPTLKSLMLKFVVDCCDSDHEHKLVLDIPAVQYLWIQDNLSPIVRAKKLPSLVIANISFFNYFEADINHWRDMFQFVENFSNAKSLTFRSPDTKKLLNLTFSFATTRFHNLTKLELEADWYLLTKLLESADKLESLTIQKVEDELKCWREPRHIPKCMLLSLKNVSIHGFAGGEHELNMVRYILRHAKVLKMIKIYSVSYGNDSKLNMLQQISYFPRGSETCLTFV